MELSRAGNAASSGLEPPISCLPQHSEALGIGVNPGALVTQGGGSGSGGLLGNITTFLGFIFRWITPSSPSPPSLEQTPESPPTVKKVLQDPKKKQEVAKASPVTSP